jgi:hypothetical protein
LGKEKILFLNYICQNKKNKTQIMIEPFEPFTYFYESINRNAIVVKGKKPLIDWVNYIYPESPISDISEGNIYLIKERQSNEEIEKWLKRNFEKIFQNELNDWHSGEDDWPQKRTFKIFKEWFSFDSFRP